MITTISHWPPRVGPPAPIDCATNCCWACKGPTRQLRDLRRYVRDAQPVQERTGRWIDVHGWTGTLLARWVVVRVRLRKSYPDQPAYSTPGTRSDHTEKGAEISKQSREQEGEKTNSMSLTARHSTTCTRSSLASTHSSRRAASDSNRCARPRS